MVAPTCAITIPLIDPAQGTLPSVVRWRPAISTLRQADGAAVVYEEQEETPVNGIVTINLPQSEYFTPNAVWIIAIPGPYGAEYSGEAPPVAGPLTLLDLIGTHNWGIVQTPGEPPVDAIVGPPGTTWTDPLAWDATRLYFVNDGVYYAGGTWRALVQNIDVPPPSDNSFTNGTWVAVGLPGTGVPATVTQAGVSRLPYSTNALDYDTLDTAIGVMGSSQGTLLVSSDATVADNLTIPANVTLTVTNGAKISVATGKTLTILGYVDAPYGRWIFTGLGTVAFPNGTATPTVSWCWWGADPTGTVDAQPAIDKAHQAVLVTTETQFHSIRLASCAVFAPPGTYLTNTEIQIINAQNFTLYGAGYATRIQANADMDSVLSMNGFGYGIIRDLTIAGSGNEHVTNGLKIYWDGSSGPAPHRATVRVTFSNIRVVSLVCQNGFASGLGSGANETDQMIWENCVTQGPSYTPFAPVGTLTSTPASLSGTTTHAYSVAYAVAYLVTNTGGFPNATAPGDPSTVVITDDTTAGQVAVALPTVTSSSESSVTGRLLLRTKTTGLGAPGSASNPWFLLHDYTGDKTTATFTDTTPDSALTAAPTFYWQNGFLFGSGVSGNCMLQQVNQSESFFYANGYTLAQQKGLILLNYGTQGNGVDFWLDTSGYLQVSGGRGEGSKHFIRTAAGRTSDIRASFQDINWHGSRMEYGGDNALEVINCGLAGGLYLQSCSFPDTRLFLSSPNVPLKPIFKGTSLAPLTITLEGVSANIDPATTATTAGAGSTTTVLAVPTGLVWVPGSTIAVTHSATTYNALLASVTKGTPSDFLVLEYVPTSITPSSLQPAQDGSTTTSILVPTGSSWVPGSNISVQHVGSIYSAQLLAVSVGSPNDTLTVGTGISNLVSGDLVYQTPVTALPAVTVGDVITQTLTADQQNMYMEAQLVQGNTWTNTQGRGASNFTNPGGGVNYQNAGQSLTDKLWFGSKPTSLGSTYDWWMARTGQNQASMGGQVLVKPDAPTSTGSGAIQATAFGGVGIQGITPNNINGVLQSGIAVRGDTSAVDTSITNASAISGNSNAAPALRGNSVRGQGGFLTSTQGNALAASQQNTLLANNANPAASITRTVTTTNISTTAQAGSTTSSLLVPTGSPWVVGALVTVVHGVSTYTAQLLAVTVGATDTLSLAAGITAVSPGDAVSQAFSASGPMIRVNDATVGTSTGNLMELQVGGVNKYVIDNTGKQVLGTVAPPSVTGAGTVPVASLPVATNSVLGVVRGDGTTITNSGGVLSAATSGGVTSVGLSAPAFMGVSSSPVTGSGTIGLSFNAQSGNVVLASPANGSSGTPTFRVLIDADLPTGITASKIGTGLAAAQIASVNPSTLTGTGTVPVAGLPVATNSALGIVRGDGTTITNAGGVLTSTVSGGISSIASDAPLSGAGTAGSHLVIASATATSKGVYYRPSLNMVDFGAAQDGSDTMIAIAAAIAALPATGGEVLMPAGTWTIQPTTAHWLTMTSGVTLRGEGAATVLKVADNQGDWKRLFTSTTANNLTFRDFCVDTNIAANTSSTIGSGTATQNVIEIFGGFNIRVERLTLLCSGVNTVTINGATVDDVTVRDCRFSWSQRGAQADFDNTCLYIHGQNYTIAGNHFRATITPGTGAKTAIEAHGGPSSVSGNQAWGFQNGIHTVATPESHGGTSVSGNALWQVNSGINVWSSSNTARSVSITGNTVDLAQVTHDQATCQGIDVLAQTSNTSPAQVIVISGNTVTHELEDGTRTTAWSNNTPSQPLTGSETYGIGAHNVGGVSNLIISDNAIDLAPGRGIVLGSQSGTGIFANVQITDNILTNPGQNTALGTGYRVGMELGNSGVTLRDVTVIHNQISDTFATTRLQKYFDTDAAGTYQRVSVYDNKLSSATTPLTSSLAVSGISTTIPIGDLPTGTTSTTLPLGNDARFSDARTPLVHETSHLPNGSDALPWLTIHGAGPDASQPVSDATNAGYLYFNTDTQRLMRSDGAGNWDIIALAGLILGTDIASNANIPRNKLGNLNISDADIAGTLSPSKIAGGGATVGQVLIWTGTQWVPGTPTTNVSYAATVNADSPYLYYQLTEVPSGSNPYVAGLTNGVGLTVSGKTYAFAPSALTRTWTGLHLAQPLNTSAETFGDYTAGDVASTNPSGVGWHDAYLAWPRDPANAPTLATTSHRSIDGTMFDPLNSANGNQNPITLTSVSCSGTTATFTTVHAHLISQNSVIVVAGVSVAGYNGTWGVATTPTSTTFTVTVPSTLASGTGGTVGLKYGGNIDWWLVNHPDWLLYTSTSTGFGTDNIPDPFNYKNTLSTGGRIATLDMTNPSLRAWMATNWWPAILGTAKYAGLYWDNSMSVNYSGVKYTLNSGVQYRNAVPSDYTAKTGWLGTSKDAQYAADMKAAWQAIYADVKTAYPNATMTNNNGLEGDSSVQITDWLNDYESTWDVLHTEPGFTHNGSQFLTGASTYPLAWNALPFFTDESTTQSTHHFLDIAGKYRDMQKAGKGLIFFQKIPGTGTIAAALSTHASTSIPVNWTAEALGGSITAAVISNRKRWMEWILSTYFMVKYHHTYLWHNERDQYGVLMPYQAEYDTVQALGQPIGDFYAVPSTAYTTAGAVTTPNALYARDYTGGIVIACADPAGLASATPTAQYTIDLTKVGPTPGAYQDLWGNLAGPSLTLSVPGNNPTGTWLQFAAVLLTNSSPTITLPAAPVDSSSNARAGGTYNGDLTWGASGLFATNLGVAFPGQNTAYVKTPSMTLPGGDGSFTIECVVNPTDYLQPLQTAQNIVANGNAALRYHPASGAAHQGKFSFTMGSDADALYSSGTHTAGVYTGGYNGTTPGPWYHVVFTYNGTTGVSTLYVNGTSEGTHTGNFGATAVTWPTGVAYIGSNASGITNMGPFIGTVDDVAFYSSALSSGRVTAHYNATT